MQDGSGCPGTTDGMAAVMYGCAASGSIHLGGALYGFPAAGCRGAGAMSTLPDHGVREHVPLR
jgi:hypothetical protein